MKKPYHYEIQDNGDWMYFVQGKQVELYDYRRAVALHAHEEKKAYEKARDEYFSRPRGAYITKVFPGKGIKNAQLAPSDDAWKADHPSCYYRTFKELEQKAAATGQSVNVRRL